MQTRQMERCFARVENPLNSGPLIYSQWAGGRKAFSSEGLKKILFDKNLLWNLFWIGGCPQNIEEVRSPSVLSLFDSNRAARLGSQLNAPIKI